MGIFSKKCVYSVSNVYTYSVRNGYISQKETFQWCDYSITVRENDMYEPFLKNTNIMVYATHSVSGGLRYRLMTPETENPQ